VSVENTCVLELDKADASINYKFTKTVAERLKTDDIPYTLHWGKINRLLDRPRIHQMYGSENVKNWKKQHSRVMSKKIQEAFNNEFMEHYGLDEYIPYEDTEDLPA